MRSVSRHLVGAIVVLHGLIHLLGAAKGLRWVDVAQLKEPISDRLGLAWLIAALLVVTAGMLLAFRARLWWLVCVVAAAASQAVIATSWSDARAGTVPNAILLIAAGYGFAAEGPWSTRASYRRRVRAALAERAPSDLVTEADLVRLPHPLAGYIRQSGAVGQPRVANFHAIVHGRIRGGADKSWMRFTGEQFNSYGATPRRFFFMDATRYGLPVDVLHVFNNGVASMRAKLCSVLPVVTAAGPNMNRAETVTLFNDLCVLAPAALVDAPVEWEQIDHHRVRGSYTGGTQTVTAELTFNDRNELVDFVSDDRLRASPNGRSFTRQRWSTPIRRYGQLDGRRLGTVGEGRWHAPAPEHEFVYLEFVVDHIAYNLGAAARGEPVGAPASAAGGAPAAR